MSVVYHHDFIQKLHNTKTNLTCYKITTHFAWQCNCICGRLWPIYWVSESGKYSLSHCTVVQFGHEFTTLWPNPQVKRACPGILFLLWLNFLLDIFRANFTILCNSLRNYLIIFLYFLLNNDMLKLLFLLFERKLIWHANLSMSYFYPAVCNTKLCMSFIILLYNISVFKEYSMTYTQFSHYFQEIFTRLLVVLNVYCMHWMQIMIQHTSYCLTAHAVQLSLYSYFLSIADVFLSCCIKSHSF